MKPEAAKAQPAQSSSGLVRGLTLPSATALNMIDMIGVGPFITIPLMISAMGGPQAMLGWILGAIFALCDGMVWAELGAAMPASGGSYEYLKQMYGPQKLGRLLSFLFIWQLSFSAPLSIASGCIGLSQYAAFFSPAFEQFIPSTELRAHLPSLGAAAKHILIGPAAALSICAILFAVILLYRRITQVAWISRALWLGVVLTMAWIIFAGFTHFSAARAFSFPPGAFQLSSGFFTGLGAAMLIAAYDYWGYYNVCFLGGEVRDPTRNIPRALIWSIVLVAALYLAMNISILGVLPWQELETSARAGTHLYVLSTFMQRIYGTWAARAVTILTIWTAFASVFSLLLGYSRIPYAAALDGNYFRIFSRVHATGKFPNVSLLALGFVACIFCFFRLADVIAALVVIRILIQFLVQAIGLLLWRARHPESPRPFRMWLYPIPALLAIFGFVYVLIKRPHPLNELRLALIMIISGLVLYFIRALRRREWPLSVREATRLT